MGIFVQLWKLFSQPLLMMVIGVVVPIVIINPVLNYFYPSIGSPLSSPLKSLEAIVVYRKELHILETEIQGYLSTNGKQEIEQLFASVDRFREDFVYLSKAIAESKFSGEDESTSKDLMNKWAALTENVDVTQYERIFTVGERVVKLTKPESIAALQHYYDISREHGIILDGSTRDTDEHEIQEENCAKALEQLLALLRQGQELISMITSIAREIETRHGNGESVEDLSVSKQTEHYNKESSRILEEMETVVRQNLDNLCRTSEFVKNAVSRLQVSYGIFHTAFGLDLRGKEVYDVIHFMNRLDTHLQHRMKQSNMVNTDSSDEL